MKRWALIGQPNSGKSSLFNALTGSHQKVGNYPGVTVERRDGTFRTYDGEEIVLYDLPGTVSLHPKSPDEEVTVKTIRGEWGSDAEVPRPEALVVVLDATLLERGLSLVLEVAQLKLPMVVALNMMDLATARGMEIDLEALSRELAMPVIPTVATKKQGLLKVVAELRKTVASSALVDAAVSDIRARFKRVDQIFKKVVKKKPQPTIWTHRIDRVVLNPFAGSIILAFVLFLVFQSVFSFAEVPKEWIEFVMEKITAAVLAFVPASVFRDFLTEGVISGVGSVLVFLPQILLLFFFVLILEDSGYMARAAFLMDKMMSGVGLHGRAFIPLLSSFACAIPGIMATRTIENRRDRLATILVAPLVTCSARLPVYALLVGAFIPARKYAIGPLSVGLQGLVLFLLYLMGIGFAVLLAFIFRKTFLRGPKPSLLLELPTYKWPSPLGLGLGLLERGKIFTKRAGTVILGLMILLWIASNYPKPPAGATEPPIYYSAAGLVGRTLEPLFRPIGFDWRISVALVPGFAAREVMVGALATVYAVENDDGGQLTDIITREWSVATGMSLLMWYVFALQCMSTLAVTKRETMSYKWPAVMLGYLTAMAYGSAFLAYRITLLIFN